MKDNKIIDRIRKLLAMAEDTSSPNEAAIAAGRAAKLMQKHNLDTANITLQNIERDDITGEASDIAHKAVPRWVGHLMIPVAHLHDCECRYARKPNGAYAVEFLGMADDATVARYVFEYLVGEIERLTRAFKRDCGGSATRKDLGDFRRGAAIGIVGVIRKLQREKREAETGHTAGTALVVRKNELIRQKYKIKYGTRSVNQAASDSYSAGRAAGSKVSIRQGAGQSSQARIA